MYINAQFCVAVIFAFASGLYGGWIMEDSSRMFSQYSDRERIGLWALTIIFGLAAITLLTLASMTLKDLIWQC